MRTGMRSTAVMRPAQGMAFRASVRGDIEAMRSAFRQGTATGDAEIMVAIFDLLDTSVAFGNSARQAIDKGAFRAWIEDGGLEKISGFLDHGDAVTSGSHRAALKIGKLMSAEEQDEGLLLKVNYNLDKTVGREAYSDLLHHPEGVQFSFGWDKTKEVVEMREGIEHVTQLYLTEWSQVGFGAQEAAHLVNARGKDGKMRAKNLQALPNRIMRAWYEQSESLSRALDTRHAYPEDEGIFGEDDETSGYVIVRTGDGQFVKVNWALDDEDEVAFDTTDTTKMEKDFKPAGRSLLHDPVALRSLFRANVELREQVSKAIEEAGELDPEIVHFAATVNLDPKEVLEAKTG